MTVTALYPEPEEPGRVPPHHAQAERALLGAMLLSVHACTQAVEQVTAADFYVPAHVVLFDALARLHAHGEPTDPVSVADVLRRAGSLERVGGWGLLSSLTADTPSSGSAGRYARIVAEHAAYRRLIAGAENLVERGYAQDDLDELLDSLKALAGEVDLCTTAEPANVYDVEEFVTRQADAAPWVVPGLLRRKWRAMVVAEEGAGKTELTNQFAVCVAAGLHPFTFAAIDPQPVLVVDLENPEDEQVARLKRLRAVAEQKSKLRAPAAIWHQDAGIDLRSRRDRSELVAILTRRRPALVCIGPMYKLYRSKTRESDEQVAAEVQGILDDLRHRFEFAMVLENHAPHGESERSRNLRPFGSSLWLRWPEFGLSLRRNRDLPTSLDVGRFRGDRVRPNAWPQRLDRGQQFPWIGHWRDGMPGHDPQGPF